MSLLGKLFGRKSLEETRAEAEQLFERGELGSAKLAFERALDRASAEPDEVRAELQARIDLCCDRIAQDRIAEARRLLERGELDLAEEELEHALLTAVSDAVKQEAEEIQHGMDRADARQRASEVEQSEDDRYATLTGGMEEDQHLEYAALGEPMRDAVLALFDGHAEEAAEMFADLAEQHPDAIYLRFELGRARLQSDDVEGGVAALRDFIGRLGPDEGGDPRLSAHMDLAAYHVEQGDLDGAVAEYQAALEAMPEDSRPYLAMGAFFRRQELPQEAAEVLEAGLSVLGEARPDFRLWQELGLAYADLGRRPAAIDMLERMVEYLAGHHHLDLPPEGAVRLSQLYEADGNLSRAIDIMRLLCEGSDRANHCVYHLEAARLLQELSLDAEARRMAARVRELLPEPGEARTAIEVRLAELGL